MSRNRLAGETSPYLLQHQDNPVDWHPWGPEALDLAKREGKPVLLSVGYAACHWCHVMAHESFENEEIARLMNRLFVNIKVDREERPDVDTIYQSALAFMGEQGGWPLTMFLTPEGEPFWGGTYFPPEPRYGRPGFPQILGSIAEAYARDPEKVAKNVAALRTALDGLAENHAGEDIPLELHDQVADRLLREVDPVNGGIGGAPKFPQPSILKLFWRTYKRTGAAAYRDAVTLTLTRMSQGGIYDHLGGGFARYAVDAAWLVPHFEKMLYDNAQLVELLTWAWQDTREPLYEQRLRETVAWVEREMMAASAPGGPPCGAFAASLDADSEGEEGKFYVWDAAEIDRVLGPDSEAFKAAYDVRPGGNWEGKTILNRLAHPGLGGPEEEAALSRSRGRLLEARAPRIRPGWDDKVLADWNGLMITALARAGWALGEGRWIELARTAFAFVAESMQRDGRLMHSWRHGTLKHAATLDDYANLSEAALALFEATGETAYLEQAETWIDTLDGHYWDAGSGGYFLTADDTEALIVRTKTVYDNATPSGNGTMAAVLARLFYLTGKSDYQAKALATISAFSGELHRNIFPLATLLNANELLRSGVQVVVAGARDADDTRALVTALSTVSYPNLILSLPRTATLPVGHPAHGKGTVGDAAAAYVCRGTTCSLPITGADELVNALDA